MKALINFVKKVFGVIRIVMETLLALYSIVATFAMVIEYKEKELTKKELDEYKPKPKYMKYVKAEKRSYQNGLDYDRYEAHRSGFDEGWDEGYREGYIDGWRGKPSDVEIEELSIKDGEAPNDISGDFK